MDIDKKQIKIKRQIGTMDGKPVIEVETIGGLFLVVMEKNGKIETLGVGPHRAVSRHIAKMRNPSFSISELAKSDNEFHVSQFEHLLGTYIGYTDDFNK